MKDEENKKKEKAIALISLYSPVSSARRNSNRADFVVVSIVWLLLFYTNLFNVSYVVRKEEKSSKTASTKT